MGRREPIATPSLCGRAVAQLTKQEFAAVQLQVRSLMQEARVLREEAMALRERPRFFADRLRSGELHRQAMLCTTEAVELMRVSCVRPEGYWK